MFFGRNVSNRLGNVSPTNHNHDGVYEPADAAIVKSDEAETISAIWAFLKGINIGTDADTVNTILNVISGDTVVAKISAYGNTQGSGRLFAGQSSSIGGGFLYHGDAFPTLPSGFSSDAISFYRSNGTNDVLVFSYPVGSNDVTFEGNVEALALIENGTLLTAKYSAIAHGHSGMTIDSDNEVISGDWTFIGVAEFGVAPNFAAASGAPFTTLLTTVVTNLNADKVDGLDGTQFLRSDQNTICSGTVTATNFIDSSDKRLKKNIKPIKESYINDFDKIEPIQYRLKKGDKDLQFGVIAQDIEKYFPDAVSVDNNGFKGVNYRSLATLTTAKVQSQQKEINELKELVNGLIKKIG